MNQGFCWLLYRFVDTYRLSLFCGCGALEIAGYHFQNTKVLRPSRLRERLRHKRDRADPNGVGIPVLLGLPSSSIVSTVPAALPRPLTNCTS
jgi:hypothetical protein